MTSRLRASSTPARWLCALAGLSLIALPQAAMAQAAPTTASQDTQLRQQLGLGDALGCFRLLGIPNPSSGEVIDQRLTSLGSQFGNELRAICGSSAVGSASSLGGAINSVQATKTVTQFRTVRRRIDQRLPPRQTTKPAKDLFMAFQAPSTSVSAGGASGLGVFGEVEREQRDRLGTEYDSAYESTLTGLSVGVDYARGPGVFGGWIGRTSREATFIGSTVRLAAFIPTIPQDPAFVRLFNDRTVVDSICGSDATKPGTFEHEGNTYGGFAGFRLGAAGFVDATVRVSRRDYAYSRGTCSIEYQTSPAPAFAAGRRVNDANGDAIADAGEIQNVAGAGVLYFDNNGNGILDVGEQVIDDIFAGTLSGSTSTQEASFSVRGGADYEVSHLVFGPRAIFTYTRNTIDAYTETGRSTAANPVKSVFNPAVFRTLGGPIGVELAYDEQSRRSMLLEAGGEIGYRFAFGTGFVTPFVAGYWRHEFDDDLQTVTVHMAQDLRATPARFDYATDGADADAAVLGFGANAWVGDRIGLRGEVSTLRGDVYFDSTVLSLQARVRF